MTQDINACREVLEAACETIERGNPMTAVDAIRHTIHFMEGLDSLQRVPLEHDETGLAYDKATLPGPDKEVLVTVETKRSKERYIKMARYSPVDGWHGNFGTSRVIAWADITPYDGESTL